MSQVMGCWHLWVFEKGEQRVTLLPEAHPYFLLGPLCPRGTQQGVRPRFERVDALGKAWRGHRLLQRLQHHGLAQQRLDLTPIVCGSLRGLQRLRDGFPVVAVTLVLSRVESVVNGQAIADQHAAKGLPQHGQRHRRCPDAPPAVPGLGAMCFLSRVPVGRWGQPERSGQLAVYLCSEAAGFIAGTDILIDGGWTAQ